jgi:hypothetical protein
MGWIWDGDWPKSKSKIFSQSGIVKRSISICLRKVAPFSLISWLCCLCRLGFIQNVSRVGGIFARDTKFRLSLPRWKNESKKIHIFFTQFRGLLVGNWKDTMRTIVGALLVAALLVGVVGGQEPAQSQYPQQDKTLDMPH